MKHMMTSVIAVSMVLCAQVRAADEQKGQEVNSSGQKAVTTVDGKPIKSGMQYINSGQMDSRGGVVWKAPKSTVRETVTGVWGVYRYTTGNSGMFGTVANDVEASIQKKNEPGRFITSQTFGQGANVLQGLTTVLDDLNGKPSRVENGEQLGIEGLGFSVLAAKQCAQENTKKPNEEVACVVVWGGRIYKNVIETSGNVAGDVVLSVYDITETVTGGVENLFATWRSHTEKNCRGCTAPMTFVVRASRAADNVIKWVAVSVVHDRIVFLVNGADQQSGLVYISNQPAQALVHILRWEWKEVREDVKNFFKGIVNTVAYFFGKWETKSYKKIMAPIVPAPTAAVEEGRSEDAPAAEAAPAEEAK